MKNWDLKGKKALITGGTKGIGEACAQLMAEAGAEVMVLARGEEDIESMSAEAAENGLSIVGKAFDMAEPQVAGRIIEHVQQTWGKLDILINNAGMNIRKATMAYADDEYDLIMQVNLRSVFELSRAAYPLLKASKGCIVNMSSVSALTHISSGSIYGMTKAALTQLTRNLAVEWAMDGIRVNCIAPWYIETPLIETVLADAEKLKGIIARTPMQRLGQPEEVAAAALFLSLPAASYITGQCLGVDGGFIINGY
ncbi:SDR family oxidoreductase [Persicitalea sp.]|uniref:SDR family oxidoreductase n=1 Tax=Persicitalea sp. TaxID=3100273 RepID=UPI00359387FA